MRLQLTFEPRVKVLSDEQIQDMLKSDSGRAEPRNPGRRTFFRRTAAAVPALLLGASAARANPHMHRLPELYPGENTTLFQEILADESAHVEILQALLIDEDNTLPTRPVPHLRNLAQPDVFAFVRAASAFENTGAGTYAGALFAIQQTQEYFPVAAGLTTVEARHAGFLNALLNEPLVPDFFPVDTPIPQSVALSHVDPFIHDLNGGTVPSFDPVVASDPNNFRIIDFLLLLEMVETAFYQVNVAKFFGG
ncbi:ferritin-like domain-containing protein [Paludisphaera borealis]|uniref:Ferritin-like domain-containing protein n=1 Tax=Paludisphaera borealis TaxID=1387353 RepID=A0A1U7CSM1_9BACT|nr:ferritin-like domain-containing protein [Paludisphaera borealis]APW61944.1 hypothetical protein BSF38_03476 [Paludisphaera borealis]